MKICTDGMLRGSFDHKLHEFDSGEAGVHCSPVSSPDLPGDAFKSEAHRFATHCHMQIEGEPVWDLFYDYMTHAPVLER